MRSSSASNCEAAVAGDHDLPVDDAPLRERRLERRLQLREVAVRAASGRATGCRSRRRPERRSPGSRPTSARTASRRPRAGRPRAWRASARSAGRRAALTSSRYPSDGRWSHGRLRRCRCSPRRRQRRRSGGDGVAAAGRRSSRGQPASWTWRQSKRESRRRRHERDPERERLGRLGQSPTRSVSSVAVERERCPRRRLGRARRPRRWRVDEGHASELELEPKQSPRTTRRSSSPSVARPPPDRSGTT